MLEKLNAQPSEDDSPRFAQHMAKVQDLDFGKVFAIAKRQRVPIGTGLAIGILIALLYILVAVPRYTAVVDILLDTPKVKAVADSYDTNSLGFEIGGVDSQVELLKAERISLGVIKKLDLKNNPAYAPKPNALLAAIGDGFAAIRDLFGLTDPAAEIAKAVEADRVLERRIATSLASNLTVKRVGRTYVLELTFTHESSGLAAQIANAFADSYLTDQLDAKYDATTRAAVWLQDRIDELRGKSLAADTKVQKFRADNGLIAVAGKLVNEDQLSSANQQLSEAKAKVADAEARAQRMEAITRDGIGDAAVTESLSNPVVAELRKKFLEASKREAEISKRLGSEHIAAANLRNEMREYERLLFEELKRIGESYRSEYQIAKSRLDTLQENLKSMLDVTAGDNQTLVQLRELERESETYKALYQTFLTRYQEAIQQQSFPINDARVITAATAPLAPSWPKKGLVLALGVILGLGLGGGAAAFLEFRDRVFRTGEQVQSELGLEFLGLLPVLGVGNERPANQGLIPGQLGPVAPTMRYSLTAPLSGFAETLRATKVGADIALRGKRPKIIGVVSVLPSEGKTTVSKNLATLVASLGSKTILIDADLRNPGLTRAIAPNAQDGLVELLQGRTTLTDTALREADSGLAVIPAVVQRKMTTSSELLSSAAMRTFLARVGEVFDYIILDLPPIGPVIDVRACADMVDAFVFVVEWGKTPRSLVRSTLEVETEVHEKCLGIVLNKVDQEKMRLYEGSEYRNYYYSKYSKYYTNQG